MTLMADPLMQASHIQKTGQTSQSAGQTAHSGSTQTPGDFARELDRQRQATDRQHSLAADKTHITPSPSRTADTSKAGNAEADAELLRQEDEQPAWQLTTDEHNIQKMVPERSEKNFTAANNTLLEISRDMQLPPLTGVADFLRQHVFQSTGWRETDHHGIEQALPVDTDEIAQKLAAPEYQQEIFEQARTAVASLIKDRVAEFAADDGAGSLTEAEMTELAEGLVAKLQTLLDQQETLEPLTQAHAEAEELIVADGLLDWLEDELTAIRSHIVEDTDSNTEEPEIILADEVPLAAVNQDEVDEQPSPLRKTDPEDAISNEARALLSGLWSLLSSEQLQSGQHQDAASVNVENKAEALNRLAPNTMGGISGGSGGALAHLQPEFEETLDSDDMNLSEAMELAIPEEAEEFRTASSLTAENRSAAGHSQAPAEARPATTVDAASTARIDTSSRMEPQTTAQAARPALEQPLNMQQPGWNKELTDKVMWMSSQNLKSAEIKLNPAELGQLDIRVQLNQEQTQITFSSAHAGVRDSLDAQMHRLREMLEQQGMHNVDVEVADRRQQEQDDQRTFGGAAGNEGDDPEQAGVTEIEEPVQGHAGLVSYYV